MQQWDGQRQRLNFRGELHGQSQQNVSGLKKNNLKLEKLGAAEHMVLADDIRKIGSIDSTSEITKYRLSILGSVMW